MDFKIKYNDENLDKCNENLVSVLINELAGLKIETKNISKQMQDILECQWFSKYNSLASIFTLWKEDINIETYSVFDLSTYKLIFKPLISDIKSPQFIIDEEFFVLKNYYSNNIEYLYLLSMGSHELQLDFVNETLSLPIVLFEKIIGVVFAKLKNCTHHEYSKICQKTENMLNNLRNTVIYPVIKNENILKYA